MPKSLCVIAARLFVTAQLLIPAAMAGEAAPLPGTMPQIVAFDNEDLLGDHIHLVGDRKALGKWGNNRSSMVIRSGTWEFFHDEGVTGTSMGTLGPGTYPTVGDKGLKKSSI
jgi:hypothetical protein